MLTCAIDLHSRDDFLDGGKTGEGIKIAALCATTTTAACVSLNVTKSGSCLAEIPFRHWLLRERLVFPYGDSNSNFEKFAYPPAQWKIGESRKHFFPQRESTIVVQSGERGRRRRGAEKNLPDWLVKNAKFKYARRSASLKFDNGIPLLYPFFARGKWDFVKYEVFVSPPPRQTMAASSSSFCYIRNNRNK